METTVTYTATASPTGAEEALLSRIRGIIAERDAYKAKCERQDKIIEKLSDLIGELQVYSVDNMLADLDALIEAEKAPEADGWDGNARPDDALIAQWDGEYARLNEVR
jgi:hypothetical protein